MFVKYIGHGDMITADWNGKRYAFRKKHPIVEIPDALYDYIKSSNFVYKHDIVFTEKIEAPVITPIAPSIIEKRRPGRPSTKKG